MKELTIDDVFVYLEQNYPMCEWKIVPTPWSKGRMISWVPEKRFIVEISLNHYRMENNKNQFISVGLTDNRDESGEGIPCDDLEIFSKNIKRVITKYDPKLFEDVQLSIF